MSIYAKLGLIQEKLEVPKKHFNKFGNYPYRNCEDILDALKPLLKEVKCVLYISDDLVLVGDRYYIKATVTLFDLEDNSQLVNTSFAREEESKKGMDGSQVSGAAGSYARKYALNGMFMIDDVKDSDTTNQGEKPENKPDNKVNKPNKQPEQPKITKEQRIQLYDAANKNTEFLKSILNTCGYNDTSEVNSCDFDNVMTAIKLKQAS